MLALSDPEIEWVNGTRALEQGTRRGLDEVATVVRAQWDAFLDGHMETDRVFELGDETISLGRLSTRMPGSEARIGQPMLMSWRTRDGKITRIEVVGWGVDDVQETLRAAGLTS